MSCERYQKSFEIPVPSKLTNVFTCFTRGQVELGAMFLSVALGEAQLGIGLERFQKVTLGPAHVDPAFLLYLPELLHPVVKSVERLR